MYLDGDSDDSHTAYRIRTHLQEARLAPPAVPRAVTSGTFAIEPDCALILDVVDQQTPGSAAWYEECYTATTKLPSSPDWDEEGD